MDQIECEFHPKSEHIVAVTSCENCRAAICPLHLFKVRTRRIDEADNVYEYCPDCKREFDNNSRIAEMQFANLTKTFSGFFAFILLIGVVIVIIMIVGFMQFTKGP